MYVDDNNTFKEVVLEFNMVIKKRAKRDGLKKNFSELHSYFRNELTTLFNKVYNRIERRL